MPQLAVISTCEDNEENSPSVNFIVVPGVAGATLDDKTCPHFGGWLATLVTKCQSKAQSWVYDNDIELEKLESWDKYSSNGHDLLVQLLSMQKRPSFHENSTFILIGHKLGCYVLKRALIEACNGSYKPDQKRLLDMIETVMMVGEPILNPRKRDEWISHISECISTKRALPERLADGLTVGTLQHISDEFEDILLLSTMVEVHGASKPRAKLFKFKKTEHDGCVCPTTIHVRMWTTASEEKLVEKGLGSLTCCGFHPKSVHYAALLDLNSRPRLLSGVTEEEDNIPKQTQLDESPSAKMMPEEEIQQMETLETTQTYGQYEEKLAMQVQEEHSMATPKQHSESLVQHYEPESATKNCSLNGSGDGDSSDFENIQSERHTYEEEQATPGSPSITAPTDQFLDEPAPTAMEERRRKTHFSTTIPPRDRLFTGRTEIVKQLTTIWNAATSNASRELQRNRSNIVWVKGVPGIGKTSIVVEFAYRSQEAFTHVLWLDATSQAQLGSYSHDSAVALGLVNGRTCQDHDHSRGKLMDWLEMSPTPWLLILDNVDERSDIRPYIPRTMNGLIIATSRHQSQTLTDYAVYCLEVPAMSISESTRLFSKAVQGGNSTPHIEAINFMTRRYRSLPLILRQVASWCRRSNTPLGEINRLLAACEAMSVIERVGATSLCLTARISGLDEIETLLLSQLSFFNPEKIPKRMLLGGRLLKAQPTSGYIKLEDTISTTSRHLWKLALLDIDDKEANFRMNRSIQYHIRSGLDRPSWDRSFQEAADCVLQLWPSPRKVKNIVSGFWDEFQPLHSHTHHLARCCGERVDRFDPRGVDPGPDFPKLLIYHTWYNARRGNEAEDRELGELATLLLRKSSSRRTRDSQPLLPRRCLVIPVDPTMPIRLQDTQGLRGEYIACNWLKSDALKGGIGLNSHNLEEYKTGIRASDVPDSLNQAIQFARSIGVSYLWHEALCVKQDDALEISEELPRFFSYFSASTGIASAASNLRLTSLSEDTQTVAWHPRYQETTYETDFVVSLLKVPDCTVQFPPVTYLEKLDNQAGGGILSQTGLPEADEFPISERRGLIEENTPLEGSELESSSEQLAEPQDIDQPPVKELSRNAEAWTHLEIARSQLVESSLTDAIGSLTLSRDFFRSRCHMTRDDIEGYVLGSAMLSTIFHLMKMEKTALEIATNAEKFCMSLKDYEKAQSVGYGRLLLSIGISLLASGQEDSARHRLGGSRQLFSGIANEDNEWTAGIDIHLAQIQSASHDYQEARRLLQSSMNYFQAQPMSPTVEGHLARILHRQSQLYEKEKNAIMQSAFTAAANSAFRKLRPLPSLERITTTSGPDGQSDPTSLDFDDLVEPWYR